MKDKSMIRLHRAFVIAVFAFLTLSRFTCGDELLTPSDCSSFLQQLKNNYASLDSFDVLIKYEELEDGEGVSLGLERACRIAYHPSTKRLSAISIMEEVDNLLHRRRIVSSALLVDGAQVWRTDFVGHPSMVSNLGFGTLLGNEGIANVQMIGASFFPNATYDEKLVESAWNDVVGAISTYGKVTTEGRSIHVDVQFPFRPSKSGEKSTRLEYVFDAATSLPTRYSCFYLSKSERGIHETLRYKSLTEWAEPHEGVHLPVSMHIQEASNGRNSSNERVPTRKFTTVELTWFSVNGEVNSRLWEPEVLFDYNSAHELCQFPISAP